MIVVLLFLDLFWLQKGKTPSFKRALIESGCWISLALIFNLILWMTRGGEDALKFLASYLIEYSLSVDNLFVFLMIFHFFHVPKEEQHKILFYGILGAIIMRALMILFGIALVNAFHPILYFFGAFLIIASVKLFLTKEQKFDPDKNILLRIAKRFGASRFVCILIAVETTDLIFALDSIPAVFAITLDLFIVFTSNILAILGLRSLYFALRGVMELFEYLHYALSGILFFVGTKMLVSHWIKIPLVVSLGVIVGLIGASILASLLFSKKK